MNKLAGVHIVWLMLLSGTLCAQQESYFSQYMNNPLILNPAYAGINDVICLNATVRRQWMGMVGAPNNLIFDGNAPIKPFGINSGVGVSFGQETYGFNKNINFSAAYSYKIDLRKGKLGIGLNAGVYNATLSAKPGGGNTGWVPPQSDPSVDGVIPTIGKGATAFDMGLGVYYKSDDIYFGFAVSHLLQPKIKYLGQSANDATSLPRNFNLMAGYRIVLPNPMFEVRPSTLIITDGKIVSLTLNTNVVYNKNFWGGVSVRPGDGIVALMGFELYNGLKIGIDYDFATTSLIKYNSGSVEFTLGYCFNLKVEKTPQKYKSVRFL